MNFIKVILAAAITLASLAPLQSAHAAGWIAQNIIKPIAGKDAAQKADKFHEKIGKPGDAVVKGAGAAAGAAIGGAVGGPTGAVIGGAVGAGATGN